ncbi:MAG: polyphosphate kinase 2 [Alphaproteobacteria bacterium HGW-Alphaproteobacteria-2]|nr:MAG: polyphosphate kinase 2 [Alphaproteobacteria bacterium HGW-Alphaproteobacteria-2]
MEQPFDGAISAFYREAAPAALRASIEAAGKDSILDPDFPYREEMKRKDYEREMAALQIELAKFQHWVQQAGARVAMVFEGRDAAGKGGAIKRFTENLNPRVARVVALPKPTERERGQWYFQRYISHLPGAGEIVFFDRSWYNRGVVEHVFGFCTPAERELFFRQVTGFEEMLAEDGIRLFKLWLNVGRAEQLRRFLAREADPLKHWKLSRIDIEGLAKWDAYTNAIAETFARSHRAETPWTVIRADCKHRTRLNAIRSVLAGNDYAHKDAVALGLPDPRVCGGPEIWNA